MSPLRVPLIAAALAAFTLQFPAAVRAQDEAAGAPQADLDTKAVQIALFDPIQIFNRTTSVKGVRINLLYGLNENVQGVDLGIVNRTTKDVKGIQIGLVSLTGGDFTGWQLHPVNFVEGEMTGAQTNWLGNFTQGMRGVQFGMINVAENARGLQIGFINVTNHLHGLQIGILNVAEAKERFSVLPIVNWSF